MSEAPLASDIAQALRYPAELAQEVLARYGQRLAAVPTGLTTAVVVDTGPPPRVVVQACSDGHSSDLRTWFDDWRRWAEGSNDAVVLGPAAILDASADEPSISTVVTAPVLTVTAWLRHLDDDVIAVLADGVLGRRPTVERVEVLHVAAPIRPGTGGESCRLPGLRLSLTAQALIDTDVPAVEQRLADLHAALAAIGAIGSDVPDWSTPRYRLTIPDPPTSTD